MTGDLLAYAAAIVLDLWKKLDYVREQKHWCESWVTVFRNQLRKIWEDDYMAEAAPTPRTYKRKAADELLRDELYGIGDV